MNQIVSDAYDVTSQLFGPNSGIPWWGWIFVLVALFWKLVIPAPKTAKETAEERDRAVLAEMFEGGDGKKGKKGKKKDKSKK
jgi:hypothetical protein